jgi:uncharacterized cupin superfamily protein
MSNKIPIRLDKSKLNGEGLDPLPPWPDKMHIKGSTKHWGQNLFAGQFVTEVYESEDQTVQLEDCPYDELVLVLSGRVIITVKGEPPYEFAAGDSFIVPKGLTGTWEMRDGFRELIVIETNASAEGEKRFADMAE